MKHGQKGRRPRKKRRNRRGQANGSQKGAKAPARSRNQAKQRVEKYEALAREALQAQDLIGAEYYFQHADHYQRLIDQRTLDGEKRPPPAADNRGEKKKRRDDVGPAGRGKSGDVIAIEGRDKEKGDSPRDDDEALSA